MDCVSRIAVQATLFVSSLCCPMATGGFTVFQGDGSAWFEATPPYSEVTFADLPLNTLVTEQYANLGVHFTDTDGNWVLGPTPTYPQDQFGLNDNVSVELTFDAPMWSFASFFPGDAKFSFFAGDVHLFTSGLLGGGGINKFAGFTTDVAFDRVLIVGGPPDVFGNPDKVFFDDFYFSSVPAPGALSWFTVMFWGSRRRRWRKFG